MPNGLLGLAAFLALPVRVLVGDEDVDRDVHLKISGALDALQGPHRLERARRWVDALHAAAEARGLRGNATLELLPGTGHSARAAIERGGLVTRTLRFLDEHEQPSDPQCA
jgi:hypothetical protein